MAVRYNDYGNNMVVPKLPRPSYSYNQQYNNDPSAYYTKALGFLPIDTRYMVNTTNSLAYNSMADVLFNKAAQEKRWEDKPWMQGILNPLRIIADAGLLFKDTVFDPIAQGITEDQWQGFIRGGSTALMNSLVNLGNTLDLVSNPIKGFVVEGVKPGGKNAFEGFWNGLVGDKNGRKQYDYNNYIDTGSGVVDFAVSLALEIVSDPLNWISFGGKQAIASGADTVSSVVTKSLKEALEGALETSAKSVDELVPVVKTAASGISDDTAKAFLRGMADESDTVSKAALSKVDELQPVLKKAITRAELSGDYSKTANALAQSKKTRYKASFFDNTAAKLTPEAQVFASGYLKNVAENLPDLMARNVNSRVARGVAARQFANKASTVLRYTAGATGLNWMIGGYKLGGYIRGVVRNALAKADPNVLKTMDDVYSFLDVNKTKSYIVDLEKVAKHKGTKEFVDEINNIHITYQQLTHKSKWTEHSVPFIIKQQKQFLTQINDLVKGLNLDGVEDLTGYIKYLELQNKIAKNANVDELLTFLRSTNTILNEDLTNSATVALYRRASEYAYRIHKQRNKLAKRGQADAFQRGQQDLNAWLKDKAPKQIEDMTKHADEVDEAIVKITNDEFVSNLRVQVIPSMKQTLLNLRRNVSDFDDSVSSSFTKVWDDFNEALKAYDDNSADDFLKDAVVQKYKDLANAITNVKALADTAPVLPMKSKILEALLENKQYDEVVMPGARTLEIESPTGTLTKKVLRDGQIKEIRYNKIEVPYAAENLVIDHKISVAQMYDELENSFKFTRENLTDTNTAKHLMDNYETLRSKLTALNRWGDTSDLTINNADQYVNAYGVSYLDTAVVHGTPYTLAELAQAIDDLPNYNHIKQIGKIIPVEDMKKFKLVWYTVGNRKADLLNRMCGIESAQMVESIKVTPSLKEAVFIDPEIGPLMTWVRDNNLLPKEYTQALNVGTNNTEASFVADLRAIAEKQAKPLSDTSRYMEPSVIKRTLDVINTLTEDPTLLKSEAFDLLDKYAYDYGGVNKTIDVIWDKYQKFLDDFIDETNPEVKVTIQKSIQEYANNYVTYLKNAWGELSPDRVATTMSDQANISLKLAAEKVLQMSDDEIANLAEFNIKEITKSTNAPLAFLIEEYKDVNSTFYKMLNNPELLEDSIDGITVKAMKELLDRIDDYINLVNNVTAKLKTNGVEDFYVSAVMDQVMTQLSTKGRILNGDLDAVTQDIINGVNIYLRQSFESPALAMDRVLGQTVTDFNAKAGFAEDVTKIVQDIEQSLKSGGAHDAVVDVDNWVGLLKLSQYSDDIRLNGMWDELMSTAAGRRIVVFDIEATDAGSEAAHVFQISGKVLNADGTIVDGSAFNYIIRPPKGYKPQPPVLEVVAPGGKNPTQWWTDEIVNAQDDMVRGIQTFDSVEDAVDAFTTHCKAQGDVILAGHNINGYDVSTLFKRASEESQKFLDGVKKFDSLQVMNSRTVYQLAPAQELATRYILKSAFQSLRNTGSRLLENRPWSGADVSTISQFKRILPERVDGLFERVVEQNLDEVLQMWRTPAKLVGENRYYVVTKLNPDALDDITKGLLDELATKGLINVAPGTNIMQYMMGGVDRSRVLLNPRRIVSYELEGVFDLNKVSEVYKIIDADGVRMQDMIKLNHWYDCIQNNRWIPPDYVDAVVDDARAFLKRCVKTDASPIARCLYDDADSITTVATAMYVYNRLSSDSPLRQIPEFAHFANSSKKIAELRGIKQYTPILNQIDAKTGKPRFIFEGDEDMFPFDKTTETLKYDTAFDSVREWRVGKNIYTAYDDAKRMLYTDTINNSVEMRKYLNSLSASERKAVEHGLKNYNTALDNRHINNILHRPNRVAMLASEAYARGGFVIFETSQKVNLADFSGPFIVAQVKTAEETYVNFICATEATLEAANDVNLALKTVRGAPGITDEAFQKLVKSRELMANNGVKNIGYSHGDLVSEEMFDTIYNALVKAGVSPDDMNKMVNIETLMARGYFNTPRANNSVIGGRSLWQWLTDDPDVHYTTDPFKQAAYSTQTGIMRMRQDVAYFCSVMFNEHNNIATAAWLKDIPPKDLVKLIKDNDMALGYVTKSGYWDKTKYITQSGEVDKLKFGLIVKEFDVVNAASIRKAREMGGVFLIPRTELGQIMKAVNEFDLPPIAKIAKGISDVYKVAYLGSLGFIVRNFIDSNFKTYASLDGMVSLPKSVSHFFQSLGYVRKHANIGQEYTKAMGKYFSSDLDYDLFYKFCNRFGESDIANKLAAEYPEKLQKRVIRQVNKLSENITEDIVKSVKPNLINPEFFSVVDNFIQHGPSAGLAKSILNEMPNASKAASDSDIFTSFNKWITEKTPARFVYGANDYIEQAARLSMFLQRLELGDNIDDALKGVIKTHFDYSDKSIGMLYTEILFPFMSFSYKNLNFWVDMISKNPLLVGSMENIFRTIFDYQGLFEPDQGAYEAYDYKFDWSKNVTSFESNMPWTYVNASRLYHLLNGNIVIDTGKDVKHDAGYGVKDNDLYRVFKLSPSVLDATKMLFNPLNTYSERLLPPAEAVKNVFVNMANGKAPTDQMDITTLANMLPYSDIVIQRIGLESTGLKHNNVFKRTEDVGIDQLLAGSLFGAIYAPQKDRQYYYNSDYNILGGFKTNYYAKRNYSNPYNSKYPSYTLTRMAQNNKPRNIYGTSKMNRVYTQQYNQLIRGVTEQSLRYRVKDYSHYY